MTREELNQKKQKELLAEEHRERRKKIVIATFKFSFIFILLFIGFYLYTTYISTTRLIVKEKRIINEKIPSNFDGLKLIHFSDLHYGSTVFNQEVDNLVKQINVRNPDLVVFTGDLIDDDYSLSSKQQEKLIKKLKSIHATLGKYAVIGEEDGENFTTILNQSEFTILNNDYDLIYNNEQNPILFVGLSSALKEQQDIDQAFRYFKEPTHNANIFTITLLHEPDSVDSVLTTYPSDLFLAGHSHNGNIRIPFLGALSKVEGATTYDQEFYQLKNSQLYISSGIGTNGFGIRLFCRPSINFFRLSSK